ncbi:MAG: hypothetical protein IJH96_04715 [Ruminococcus sp.]|nr:hypothetical protein [Ruminococcus sp.]
MLTYILTFADKSECTLTFVLSARLKSELDVPADSLSVTLPYTERLRENADMLSVFDGGKRVFFGQIDEVLVLTEKGKQLLRFHARSLAACLLDNEAEPLVYANPSNRMMFDRHLAPFGITACEEERHPLYDNLRIEKGMSHWQVLESYCAKRYGATPRIADTRAYLKGFRAEGEIVFGGEGVPVLEMTDSLRRCKLISEVRVRMTNTGCYSARIINDNPHAMQLTRVRYVNAAADNASLDTARRMMEKGNQAARHVSVKCVGDHLNILGKSAVINGETGFTVTGLSYVFGDQGAFTTVNMRKEN